MNRGQPSGVRPRVVIVGSANMDLVAAAPRVPRPGETVLGGEFRVVQGGKGANQAVAAARLDAEVTLVARVGGDDFGRELLAGLSLAGVRCDHVAVTAGVSSGVALIVVGADGQNAICVVPGANGRLTVEDVEAAAPAIAEAKVCVVQLEIPMPTVLAALDIARRSGVETIVDPAPAPADPPAALLHADVLTPNETEAATLLGTSGGAAAETARQLRRRGCGAVVLKRGADGAFVCDASGEAAFAPPAVEVVDTTGAGDAFTAALAVARAGGATLAEAARFAVAAGSVACTRFGAQPSMPRLDEVRRLCPS